MGAPLTNRQQRHVCHGKHPTPYHSFLTLTLTPHTDTALDSFAVLKNRPYEDKFQRTRGLEKEATDCAWGEQMEFLVDAPDEVSLGVRARARVRARAGSHDRSTVAALVQY